MTTGKRANFGIGIAVLGICLVLNMKAGAQGVITVDQDQRVRAVVAEMADALSALDFEHVRSLHAFPEEENGLWRRIQKIRTEYDESKIPIKENYSEHMDVYQTALSSNVWTALCVMKSKYGAQTKEFREEITDMMWILVEQNGQLKFECGGTPFSDELSKEGGGKSLSVSDENAVRRALIDICAALNTGEGGSMVNALDALDMPTRKKMIHDVETMAHEAGGAGKSLGISVSVVEMAAVSDYILVEGVLSPGLSPESRHIGDLVILKFKSLDGVMKLVELPSIFEPYREKMVHECRIRMKNRMLSDRK